MAIGKLMCTVIDVDDLGIAEAFWSEVTGLPVIPSFIPGRYSYLGQPDPWKHELILHRVKTRKGPEANRAHVDIWVRHLDEAIAQVEAIGGRLKRPPSIYPRPGSFPGEPPLLDWAVVQDPFGNEFCLITLLSPEQVQGVEDEARRRGTGTDEDWRAAARRTAPTKE